MHKEGPLSDRTFYVFCQL